MAALLVVLAFASALWREADTYRYVGIGLVLGWVSVFVLTFHWSRVVWARSSYHLAMEAERRRQAAEQEAYASALYHKDPEQPT